MSLQPALRPNIRPAEKSPERTLVPVAAPERRRRPRIMYAVIALGGAALIGATQMVLSVVITQDSYALADLRSEQRELTFQSQALKDDIAGLSSPQYLAESAAAMGMVVAGTPAQLRLSDGAVLGSVEGAPGGSTVNPVGNNAVANALLVQALQQEIVPAEIVPAEDSAETEVAAPPVVVEPVAPTAPELPPAITEGLPSPTTR